MKNKIEHGFETLLFGARWLAAPLSLGLVLALLMLLVVFAREMLAIVPQLMEIQLDAAVLAILSLIDIVLILSYTDRLRINLDELCERVLQPAADRNRTAHGQIQLRKFLARDI